jgi:hypothetical protein
LSQGDNPPKKERKAIREQGEWRITLLERIEKHLEQHRISATRFGRWAIGDPKFVLDLRMGRIPRRRTILRLESYLARYEANSPLSMVASMSPERLRGCSSARMISGQWGNGRSSPRHPDERCALE